MVAFKYCKESLHKPAWRGGVVYTTTRNEACLWGRGWGELGLIAVQVSKQTWRLDGGLGATRLTPRNQVMRFLSENITF